MTSFQSGCARGLRSRTPQRCRCCNESEEMERMKKSRVVERWDGDLWGCWSGVESV